MKIFPLAALAAALSCLPTGALAQDLSSDQIRCKLDPTCVKPGFRSLPFGKRGVTVDPAPAEDKPNAVSLHVTFAYNSAELLNDSLITLDALGTALVDPSLASARFMIAGHTDSRGTDEYNQSLSERRADAVARYLAGKFKIDSGKLEVAGFGESELFDARRPEDQINRRVQVINLSANAQ